MAVKHAAEQWQGKREELEKEHVKERKMVPLAQVYLHICPACPFSLLELFYIRKKTKKTDERKKGIRKHWPSDTQLIHMDFSNTNELFRLLVPLCALRPDLKGGVWPKK